MRRNLIADEHRDPTVATDECNLRVDSTPELRTVAEIVEHSQIVDLPDCRSPITNSR